MAKNDKIQSEQEEQIIRQHVESDRAGQQRKVRFIEEDVKTNYAGIFNIGFGAEAVLFIFGNQSVEPNVVRIESKVAVSLKTAKRITVTLSNMIRRYEAANGVIDITAPKAVEEKTKIQ